MVLLCYRLAEDPFKFNRILDSMLNLKILGNYLRREYEMDGFCGCHTVTHRYAISFQGSGRLSFGNHRILQGSDGVDYDFDSIAGLQVHRRCTGEPHPAGRAGHDHRARQQCHAG